MKNTLFLAGMFLFTAAVAHATSGSFSNAPSNRPLPLSEGGQNLRPQDLTLQQMQEHLHNRVVTLDSMTDAQWTKLLAGMQQRAAQNGKKLPNLTLAQVQARAHEVEKKFDAMTPAQWDQLKARLAQRRALGNQPAAAIPQVR